MVAVTMSADEGNEQTSGSSPEEMRHRRRREPAMSRSPSQDRAAELAVVVARRTRSLGVERQVERQEGVLVVAESRHDTTVKGNGKGKARRRSSSSVGTRGRSGQRAARDAAGQVDVLPRAPSWLPQHGVPRMHGGWMKAEEHVAETRSSSTPASIPLMDVVPLTKEDYGPVKRAKMSGKVADPPIPGGRAEDRRRPNRLQEDGHPATNPVQGGVAEGSLGGFDIERALEEIIENDVAAVRWRMASEGRTLESSASGVTRDQGEAGGAPEVPRRPPTPNGIHVQDRVAGAEGEEPGGNTRRVPGPGQDLLLTRGMDVDPMPRSENDGMLPVVMDVDGSNAEGDTCSVYWTDSLQEQLVQQVLESRLARSESRAQKAENEVLQYKASEDGQLITVRNENKKLSDELQAAETAMQNFKCEWQIRAAHSERESALRAEKALEQTFCSERVAEKNRLRVEFESAEMTLRSQCAQLVQNQECMQQSTSLAGRGREGEAKLVAQLELKAQEAEKEKERVILEGMKAIHEASQRSDANANMAEMFRAEAVRLQNLASLEMQEAKVKAERRFKEGQESGMSSSAGAMSQQSRTDAL